MPISKTVAWGVPAVVATAVAAGLAVVPVVAGASPALAHRTAAQLLSEITTAQDVAFSGNIVQTSRLGLPSVPGLDSLVQSSGASGTLGLLTGSHDGKIWYAGKDKVRLSATVGTSDTAFFRNGRDVWVWDSSAKKAEHTVLPVNADASIASASPTALTPQELADRALAAVSPSTEVSVDGTASVAGRTAYELVLRPKATGSLVQEIRLALDSKTYVPLRAQVWSTKGNSAPALEVTFSSITFAPSPDSVFTFQKPAGTTVEEHAATGASAGDKLGRPRSAAALPGKAPDTTPGTETVPGSGEPKVIGSDWTTVVELPAGSTGDLRTQVGGGASTSAAKQGSSSASSLLKNISLGTHVSGTWGSGSLLETNLVTVLLLDDGRAFVGAVTPDVLEKAVAH